MHDTNVWARSRVLVTGGAGFIGSALVCELNRRGCSNVVIADSAAASARKNNLRALRFTDYLDAYDALSRLRAGTFGAVDFIFHLGACSSTMETNVEFMTRNNFEFSRDLAECAFALGARLVYASSAATYGDGSVGMDDSDLQSIARLQPLNLYGQSKQRMDMHALRHGWLERVVALKYFNVFGPNEEHKGEMQSVVRKGFSQVMEAGLLRLFKSYRPDYRDGEQKRDFLWVKDAVNMTLHLAANPAAAGIFNIGSGEAHTWLELGHALFSALGRPPKIEFVEMPEAIRDKYQYFTQANIWKLRAAGYAAAITPVADAVRDYVGNYLLPGKSLGEEGAGWRL